MQINFPMPEQQTLLNYIIQSNEIAQVPLSMDETLKTLKKQFLHPGAAGHFTAISFVIDHARKSNFPTKHSVDFENESNSAKNLYWLNKLNLIIMKPFAEYGEAAKMQDQVSLGDCGNYRLVPASVALRPLPLPNHLIKLMHFWYSDLAAFHLKWLPQFNKPTTITLDHIKQLADFAYHKHIQLTCIHPWLEGNGRTSRLLENLLRLRWGLPWKTIYAKHKQQYVNDIMNYENSATWQTVLKNATL